VVIPKDRAAGVTPATVKTSAGATEHMPIAQVTNLSRALEQLKEAGMWIAGAVLEDGAQAPWEIDFSGPTALVIGAEGAGIRPLVARHCDFQVRIPVLGQVSALSAPAAGCALLYEVARQRLRSKETTP
jgi:23S rRNA (guanosine2251-2'-O)-methyltransferase